MAAGEECDDLESWEEMEDSGILDKKLEKLKAAMSTSIQKDFRGGNGKNNSVVFLAENGRTRYVPPKPTVKILKRPSIMNNSHNAGGDGFIINGDNAIKPKQPIKTLQQREIEYAEARLRILGEAQSPDERPTLLDRIRRIHNKTESSPDNTGEQSCITSPVIPSGPCYSAVFSPLTVNQIASTTNNIVMAPTNNCVPNIFSSPQPTIIMTSGATQLPPMPANMLQPTQMGVIKTCTVASNNASGMGQYNIIGSNMYVNTNNGCSNGQYGAVSYNAVNTGSIYCHNTIVPNHQNTYITYNSCNNVTTVPHTAVLTGAGFINTSIVSSLAATSGNSYLAIQAPVSLNLAIRQPKGPDGTKGFSHFRNTLR